MQSTYINLPLSELPKHGNKSSSNNTYGDNATKILPQQSSGRF
jgi:hypothetical protein